MSRFHVGQHIHCVGIGGFGISAIARILLEQGYKVSGSDLNSNALTEALARDGVKVYAGHKAEWVNGADIVIITSAAKPGHVEIQAAKAQGIPVYKRNEIIADLMDGKTVIAVAGTHGKTTTTSMIVHILEECGKDPSYIVGGVMGNTGTNAGVGKGDVFVIEADEYDNMFLGLKPDVAVITSIEFDHPDFFATPDEMLNSFRQFVRLLDENGTLVICCRDESANKLYSEQAAHQAIRYDSEADYPEVSARNVYISQNGYQSFNVTMHDCLYTVKLPVYGVHNALNALAALIVADQTGVPVQDGITALATFKSTGRRFDIRGEVDSVIVVDDYAHHPTAIKVTLEAAKMRYPDRQIWAVWQPHTFSRTQALLDQFAGAFGAADMVLVTDIYKSREMPTETSITGQQTADAIQHGEVHYTGTLENTADFLIENIKVPAVIVIMSAGDAPKIGEMFLQQRGV